MSYQLVTKLWCTKYWSLGFKYVINSLIGVDLCIRVNFFCGLLATNIVCWRENHLQATTWSPNPSISLGHSDSTLTLHLSHSPSKHSHLCHCINSPFWHTMFSHIWVSPKNNSTVALQQTPEHIILEPQIWHLHVQSKSCVDFHMLLKVVQSSSISTWYMQHVLQSFILHTKNGFSFSKACCPITTWGWATQNLKNNLVYT
jgi:hypothetical protein